MKANHRIFQLCLEQGEDRCPKDSDLCDQISEDWKAEFLAACSATDDNQEAAKLVKYAVHHGAFGRTVYGLQVGGVLLSELLYTLEELGPPDSLKGRFPSFREEHWEAALRILTGMISNLDCLERVE